jgi:hypothetical protein
VEVSAWPPLRGSRGAHRVGHALAVAAGDPAAVVARCLYVAEALLSVRDVEVAVDDRPCRTLPSARGRHLAGVVTLYPRAFADPFTLAWTALHELAHAGGADEVGAEAFAASVLGGGPC